jgi:hypothetical protein
MNEDAANAAAQANLKGAYKECAYKIARGEGIGAATYSKPVDDGYFVYTGNTGVCNATLKAELSSSHTDYDATDNPWIAIVVGTGVKTENSAITGVTWL